MFVNGSTKSILSLANFMYFFSLSIPIKFLLYCFYTAPIVPVPKKGSNITSPGLVTDNKILVTSASGF